MQTHLSGFFFFLFHIVNSPHPNKSAVGRKRPFLSSPSLLFILFRNPAFQSPSRINSRNPDNTESFTSFPRFPSLFSQVHFPKLKLHYAAILLSQGKVIIFRCCRHFSTPLHFSVCCVSVIFTESESAWKVLIIAREEATRWASTSLFFMYCTSSLRFACECLRGMQC